MQETKNPIYRLSGNLGLGPVMIPIGGVIAIAVLSLAYAYINVYSPIAGYISILFVGGFAFGVGTAFSVLAHLSKCRNIGYTRVFGAIAGLLALYTSWAMFIQVLFARDIIGFEGSKLDIFMDPSFVWEAASLIADGGWYSLGSFTPSGMILWIFWLVEAAIIVGLASFISASSLEGEVFCEACNDWADQENGITRLQRPKESGGVGDLAAENISLPLVLPPFERGKKRSLRFDRWHCSKCDQLDVLLLNSVEFSRDENGQWTENETPIGYPAVVPYDIVTQLMDWKDVCAAKANAEKDAAAEAIDDPEASSQEAG